MAEETGRRLDNPLGVLSSYTYQISLYMVSPTAYDAFTSTGRTKIEALQNIEGSIEGAGTAFLIAQSITKHKQGQTVLLKMFILIIF